MYIELLTSFILYYVLTCVNVFTIKKIHANSKLKNGSITLIAKMQRLLLPKGVALKLSHIISLVRKIKEDENF